MRETLFIGGPWDGRVEDVIQKDATTVFVPTVEGPFEIERLSKIGGRVEPHEYTIEMIRAPDGCDPDVEFLVAISEEITLAEAIGALLQAYRKAAGEEAGS